MARTNRRPTASRNVWGQIGLSACVLLLPPILAGAAVYTMFPVHQDGSAHNSSLAAAQFQPADSEFRQTSGSSRDAAAPQPSAAAAPPPASAAGTPAPPSKSASPTPSASAPADAHSEPAGKDISRVSGPVPVRVTTIVAPNTAIAPFTDDVDSTQSALPGSREAALSQPAPDAEPPPAVRAVPSAETPPKVHAVSLHRRLHSYVRQLARRSPAQDEAHTKRLADNPRDAFSLRNWFQQLGGRRGAQRG
jgi:hypothetical protein